jgi:ketosteroid isomerase-like protein
MSELNPLDWVDTLTKLWQQKQVNEIVALFADDCEYFKTPFKKVAGIENIKKQWQAILAMKDMRVHCPTIVGRNDHIFANYELQFDGKQQSIALELKIKNGKCIFLKQWTVVS